MSLLPPLIIALAMVADINLLGRLTGAEILLFAALPFVIRHVRPQLSAEKWFYRMWLLWVAGAFMTDLYRDTPSDDLVRGWAKILIFAVNFTAIRGVIGRDVRKLLMFIVFLYFSSAVRLAIGLTGEDIGNEVGGNGWKFGYGQLASILALLLSSRLIKVPLLRLVGLAVPYLSTALNLLLNARNLAGTAALAAVTVSLTAGRRRPMSAGLIAGLVVALGITGFGMIKVYEYAAQDGMLGAAARAKYQQQSHGNLSIFYAGRPEFLASTQAIIDSPILGHGSWARDISYVKLMVNKLAAAGIPIQGTPFDNDLIPTHSHLLGAWVESGILGALFWFWVLLTTVRGLMAAVKSPSNETGLFVFIGVSLLWDIVFSPFGLERRIVTAAWIYLMILIAAPKEEMEKKKEKKKIGVRQGVPA